MILSDSTTNKFSGVYSADGNSLTIENEDGLQHTVSLPTTYAVKTPFDCFAKQSIRMS